MSWLLLKIMDTDKGEEVKVSSLTITGCQVIRGYCEQLIEEVDEQADKLQSKGD